MKNLITLISFFFATAVFAQLPETDIWLFELGKTKKGIILKNGSNITDKPGYQNQPHFSPDNKNVFYTAAESDLSTNIYRYETGSKKTIQVTSTAVSEYSPQIMPDGKLLSVVVVEADSAQRVWKLNPVQKKGVMVDSAGLLPVIPEIDSIGYYSFLNRDSFIYYKLTDPHSLRVASLSGGGDHWIANEPGRSFKLCGNKKFFYIIKKKEENELRIYDWRLRKSTIVTAIPADCEDVVWDKNLGFVRSDKNKLMRYDEKLKMWLEVADLSAMGINKITRFAFSPSGRWLAVVNNK